MYILTALGQDTISTLKVPHKQNFRKSGNFLIMEIKKLLKSRK